MAHFSGQSTSTNNLPSTIRSMREICAITDDVIPIIVEELRHVHFVDRCAVTNSINRQKTLSVSLPEGHRVNMIATITPSSIEVNQYYLHILKSNNILPPGLIAQELRPFCNDVEVPMRTSDADIAMLDPNLITKAILSRAYNPREFQMENYSGFLAQFAFSYGRLFVDAYEEYTGSPDVGVHIAKNEEVMKVNNKDFLAILKEEQPDPPEQLNRSEWDFVTSAIILAMVKNFVNDTQVEAFLRARYNAYSNLFTNCRIQDALSLVPVKVIRDTYDAFKRLPVFKARFFNLVLNLNLPFTPHLLSLLEETQMTVFCMINDFLSAKPLTMLHLHPIILEQALAYLAVLDKLIEKFGMHRWKYAKLVEPNLMTTQRSSWNELATGAYLWTRAHSSKFQNFRFPNMSRRINFVEKLSLEIVPGTANAEKTLPKLLTPRIADMFEFNLDAFLTSPEETRTQKSDYGMDLQKFYDESCSNDQVAARTADRSNFAAMNR